MKKIKLIFISLLVSSSVFAGAEGGGGGAFVKAKFMSKAQAIARQIRIPGENVDKINLVDLEALLSEIDLSVSDTTLKDKNGESVDALNFYPENKRKLILYGPSWSKTLSNDEIVYILVYHEILSLLGIDDTNHKVSRAFQIRPAIFSGSIYLIEGLYETSNRNLCAFRLVRTADSSMLILEATDNSRASRACSQPGQLVKAQKDPSNPNQYFIAGTKNSLVVLSETAFSAYDGNGEDLFTLSKPAIQ